ncbi:hypothetical protein AT15_07560 [Kosmotoga arenicorallina S304]|uniref:Permease n=1 Tax=Kosmotoga arenicorallina S304 TaxID=1453497 RepID=A0A182C767_9BACT|nr:AI-2E family transporter [Kosmotoga arenicorallina]OAA31345.1 hypothetical protein AT15_07560 [Kosmotoga arenicorallina S304]
MNNSAKWILGYFIAYIISLFVFPMTTRVITLSVLIGMIIIAPARMAKKRSYKRLLSLVTLGAIVITFVYLLYIAVPIIIKGVQSFRSGLVELDFSEISSKLNEPFSSFVNDTFEKAGSMLGDFLLQASLYISKNIASWITFGILLVVAAVFLTTRTRFFFRRKAVHTLFPGCEGDEVTGFFKGFYRDLQGYITGQLIVALAVGSVIGFGAFFFKIQQALFLGLLAGITNFIPFFGVIVTAIPLLVIGYISYTDAPILGVVFALLLLVVANQLEMWVLSPRIMSRRLKLNWFIILLSMIACSELFGVYGIVLAVPLVIFIRRYWGTFLTKEVNKYGNIRQGLVQGGKRKKAPPEKEGQK